MSRILGGLIDSHSPINGQPLTRNGAPLKTDVESHPGGFFAIDSRIWAKVTAYGMNEAVAYLVLACGSGHGNRSTSWSTSAVMKYAGIGWIRAKATIVRLITGGFVRNAESHTQAHPRYELATYRELMEHEAAQNPPAQPDRWEREVLSAIEAGKQPRNKPDRNRADRLYERGLLRRDATGVYKLPEPLTEDSAENLIWLPNEIVTGTSRGEESPLKRLRSAGCAWTLRLFVDLYSTQNLRDDGGISPSVIRQPFDRRRVGYQSGYDVWGFGAKCVTHTWTGPFAVHKDRINAEPDDDCPMSESVDLLEEMGLLSFIPHVFENDTDVAEPFHVYGTGKIGEIPVEKKIGDAADRAARAMAVPKRIDEAKERGFEYFCPIQQTKPSAQMIGVARLTYRPHTRRTASWFAELQRTAPAWIETFRKLTEKAEMAALTRKAKCA